jgi:hypothetical protein
MRATKKKITDHIISLAMVIPTRRVKAGCAQLLFAGHRLRKVLMRVEERRERRMVGKRIIPVSM